jgi:hypothetical protein
MMRAGDQTLVSEPLVEPACPGVAGFDAERGDGQAPGTDALIGLCDEHRREAKALQPVHHGQLREDADSPLLARTRKTRYFPNCCASGLRRLSGPAELARPGTPPRPHSSRHVARAVQRLLALNAPIWHNWPIGARVKRSLIPITTDDLPRFPVNDRPGRLAGRRTRLRVERFIERDELALQAEDGCLGPVGEAELGQDA